MRGNLKLLQKIRMFDEHRLRPARDLGKQAPGENAGAKEDAIAKCIVNSWEPGTHDLSKNHSINKDRGQRIDHVPRKAKDRILVFALKLSLHTAGDESAVGPEFPDQSHQSKTSDSTWVDDGRKTSHCYEGTNAVLECKLI